MSVEAAEREAGEAARLWWIVFAANPFWTQFASFFYAGVRAHRGRWVAWAGVYAAVAAGSFAAIEVGGVGLTIGTIGTFGAWAVGLVHAFAIRHEYLARLDLEDDARLENARQRLRERRFAGELAHDDPWLALESGVGRPDVAGSFDAGVVDLNHASAKAIAALPDVGPRLAHRIVAVRDRIGGFESVDDAGALLDLPAALVDSLRGRAVCLRA